MKEALIKVRQYLLTGVSFAIPFIACGGIMIAAAIALAPMTKSGPDFSQSPILKLILDIGVTSFTLMPAILAGYIAYAIAGKPGLVAGFVGGWLATHLGVVPTDRAQDLAAAATDAVAALTKVPLATAPLADLKHAVDAAFGSLGGAEKTVSAGFLGALVAGLLAGYVVYLLKKLPTHKYIKPIMPILIIPIVSASIVGVVMLKVVGLPIAELMTVLGQWLETMHQGNAVVLAAILGAMIAFDMGGPVNKAAFFFGAGLLSDGHYAVMGCIAAAICTPPLGLGLATLIRRKIWTQEEREAGGAALTMGMIGITEGAIPFAAADPIRVIPCIMLGSMVASVVAMLGGVGDHAPHGGPIVLPVVDHRWMYVVAIVCGTLATAGAIIVVKGLTSKMPEPEEQAAGAN